MNGIPPITKNLIIINILFFFGDVVAAKYGINLSQLLGLHFLMSDFFNPVQLFSYMFMHGGFSHLFFNMFALFMFGPVLEQYWGSRKYLFYYIACGLGAGLIQEMAVGAHFYYLYNGMAPDIVEIVMRDGAQAIEKGMNFINPDMAMLNSALNTSMVGASGSIYGILLAFGMLFPNTQMFVFPLPMPIKAKFIVIFYVLLELYLGLSNNANDNVAHFAHLGGMLFGFIMILYWRKKGRRNEFVGF